MLCALPLAARTLTPDEALRGVQSQFKSGVMRAPAALSSSLKLTKTVNTTKGEPAIYIFAPSQGEGMVIASAETSTPAILGYTDRSTFNPSKINPNLQYWLDAYAAQIQYLRTLSAPTHPFLSPAARADAKTEIQPICQTEWDQDTPYNNFCPSRNGEATCTGCVATAMAQAMKVFDWPEHGVGTVSYQWENGGRILTQDLSQDTYDWGLMVPNFQEVNTSYAQDSAIATLMRDVGYSVQMNYNTISNGGSGAYSRNIPAALISHFNYDMGLYQAQRDNYSQQSEWNDLIYNELANGRPVIYSGITSNQEGHCFICDGYRADGYFHINWGWSGMDDGYFLLSALNPSSLGIGGGSGASGFNYQQDAIVGMQKPTGDQKPHVEMTNYGNFTVTPTEGSLNDTFSFSGQFVNTSPIQLNNMLVGLQITDEGGDVSYVVAGSLGSLDPYYYFESFRIDGEDMPTTPGTYTVKPAFYASEDEEWHPMLGRSNTQNSLTMTVTETTRSFGAEQSGETGDASQIYATDLTVTPTTFALGETFRATATIHNLGDEDYSGSIYGVLVREENGTYYSYGKASPMKISVPYDSEIQITYSSAFTDAQPGDYDLYLAIGNSLICQDPVAVTITDSTPASPELTLTDLRLMSGKTAEDGVKEVTKDDIQVRATLKAVGSAFTGTLDADIFNVDGNYLGTLGSQVFDIAAGKKAALNITGAWTQGEEGTTYLLAIFNGNERVGNDTLRFRINSSVDVKAVSQSEPKLLATPTRVYLTNATPGCQLSIYGADGTLKMQQNATMLDITPLPTGIYIATATTPAGTLRVKFHKF